MEKTDYQKMMKELEEKKVSTIKSSSDGFEIESKYFEKYQKKDIQDLLNNLDFSLKVNLNSLVTYAAIYDAKRTKSSEETFKKQFEKVLKSCNSEIDFVIFYNLYEQLALEGGVVREGFAFNLKMIDIMKKLWKKNNANNNVKTKEDDEKLFLFKRKYKYVADLCEKILGGPSINEEKLDDLIEQIEAIRIEFNEFYNQLKEDERKDIDREIQDMLNSASNTKELMEEDKRNWAL